MKIKKPLFLSQLSLFFLLFLILALVIVFSKINTNKKQTIFSKAQTTTFFGFNIHSLPLLEEQQIKEVLSMVSQCNNTNMIRFWVFSAGGESYEARRNNAINNLDKVLKNAPANIKFIITLSNYYSSGVFQPWVAPEDNPTKWFCGDWKNNGFLDFVNSVTTKYKGNSKIFMWEIMNEPNCTADEECSKAQHQFLNDVSTIIAKNDPGKLISPGPQGQNTGGEHFDNGDYETITQLPNITANSCHLYIGSKSADPNRSKANCLKALEITKKNNKLFYLGEFGGEYGCTSAECTNTCSSETLQTRKTEMTQISQELVNLGVAGVLIWQFSPERNSTLTCDGSSVFPGDPFCQITGSQTLTQNQLNNTGNTTGTTNATNSKTNITFSPTTPQANTAFKIIINSATGFVWVHVKIFDKEGKKLIQEGKKTADQPKVAKTNSGYQWTYDMGGLSEGDYQVIFYNNCDKGCYEQVKTTLSIGVKKQTATETPTNKPTNKLTTTGSPLSTTTKISNKVSLNQNNVTFMIDDIVKIGINPQTLKQCQMLSQANIDCSLSSENQINGQSVTVSYSNRDPLVFCGEPNKPQNNQVNQICFLLDINK